MLGLPTRRAWSCQEAPQSTGRGSKALQFGHEWSGDPDVGPGVVGRPPKAPGGVRRLFRLAGSDIETLPNGRVWLVGTPGGLGEIGRSSLMLGAVERSSQMTGIYREALPVGRKWSCVPCGRPGVVERPFQMAGSSQVTFLEHLEWLVGPPG